MEGGAEVSIQACIRILIKLLGPGGGRKKLTDQWPKAGARSAHFITSAKESGNSKLKLVFQATVTVNSSSWKTAYI